MDEFSTPRHSSERRARGRPFTKGNPGRKSGSKNRTTLVAQALLENEKEALLQKAIELAKAGDVQMLKFLLDRILPKERSIHVELPKLLVASDTVDALGAIVDGVANGQIAPYEAASLATLIDGYARAFNVADLELRLGSLERELQQLRNS